MALRNFAINWTYDTSVPVGTFKVVIKDAGGVVLIQSNALGPTVRAYTASNVNVGDASTSVDITVAATNNDGTTSSDVVQKQIVLSAPNPPVITTVTVTQ